MGRGFGLWKGGLVDGEGKVVELMMLRMLAVDERRDLQNAPSDVGKTDTWPVAHNRH